MQQVELPLLHCYRCGNVWTPVKRWVKRCPRCKSVYWDEPKIRVPSGGGGLGIREVIEPHRKQLEKLTKRYGVIELRVFGSVARGQASADSDVDLLVEFARSASDRGSRRYRLYRDLTRLLRREVELVAPESLHWFVQPQVLAESVPL